jgi:uncharacterized protein (TIGR00730 family)
VKPPRYRTGDAEIDATIAELVDRTPAGDDADLIYELVTTSMLLGHDQTDRGDLKIANAALKELRHAFQVFAPYRSARKVAIFGSARTRRDDPLYDQARRFAAAMADRDWMIITGAGPGIMEAGIEGAGPDNAFGVSIRLPFESPSSQFVADDPKLIRFRYFFTRKVTFIKESHGFVLLPGGYGTMDEAFELLTLVQTGKAPPAPIVLLDIPGGSYWQSWREWVERELGEPGYLSPHDLCFVKVTDDIDVAVDEVLGFFGNYHSLRFVNGQLVLRMCRAPSNDELVTINAEFADLMTRGSIERIDALSHEVADDDFLHLERLLVPFDRRNYARLRELIDRVNGRPSHT